MTENEKQIYIYNKQLVDASDWQMVDTYQLEEYEHGMAMKVMTLSDVSNVIFPLTQHVWLAGWLVGYFISSLSDFLYLHFLLVQRFPVTVIVQMMDLTLPYS